MYQHIQEKSITNNETTIVTTRGTFKQSEAQESLKRIAQQEAELAAAKREEQMKQIAKKECPIRSARSGLGSAKCEETCGFYTDDGCALSLLAKEGSEIANAEGRRCPMFPGKCSSACAWFENGCAIARLATKNKCV